MTRFALAITPFLLAGCGTVIPLYDKQGATRDQEFKDRVACVQQRQGVVAPGLGVTKCMQEKGYTLVATETP